MVAKTTQRSSRHTKRPGISPSMMRVKRLGMAASRSPVDHLGASDVGRLRPMTVGEPRFGSDGAEAAVDTSRILTVPNVISLVRLLCLPLFVYLLFGRDNRAAAAGLLAVLGATDWVDGYIARHFHQVSDLGKILDPVADRLLFFVGVACILIDGSVPVWFAAHGAGPGGGGGDHHHRARGRSAPGGSTSPGAARRAPSA